MQERLKVDLVPKITDKQIEEMLGTLTPIKVPDSGSGLARIIKTKGVDRRGVAFTWDPKLGREVNVAWVNDYIAICPTFHTFSFHGFFKPSLAETLACIRKFVPDWEQTRFFSLQMLTDDRAGIIGDYHIGRCFLYGPEHGNVLDTMAKEVAAED